MTETEIQNLLAARLRRRSHVLIVPNVSCFGAWEADLVSVTQTGYAIEYEIKRSASDFERDSSKTRHRILSSIHERDKASKGAGPARFFYVFDASVPVHRLSIPDYAGVVKAEPLRKRNGEPYDHSDPSLKNGIKNTNISDAPLLHDHTITTKTRAYLARGLMHRYWDERQSDG